MRRECKIMYAENKGFWILKLLGSVTYLNSEGLSVISRKISSDSGYTGLIVDMEETDYIDSTNLGLLAGLAKMVLQKGMGYPQLYTENTHVTNTIKELGLNTIYDIVERDRPETPHLKEIKSKKKDWDKAKARTIYNAHKELMELNDQNKLKFRSVVDNMKQDLGEDLN